MPTKSSYPAAALSTFEAVKGNRIILFFGFLNNLVKKKKEKKIVHTRNVIYFSICLSNCFFFFFC